MSLFEDRSGLVLVLIIVFVLATMLLAAVLFFKLLLKFRPVHDQLAPMGAKVAFWGAVAYSVLPTDFLPDPIYLDDIGALVAALAYINASLGRNELNEPDGLGEEDSN